MNEASRLAALGCPHGTIVGADEQTAGQGRHGRSWHSAPGEGLYVSLVLRLRVEPASLPVVTLALGLAAAAAIGRISGVICDLRWPNDVLVGGRKCCGILTQLSGGAVIAGIGINLNQISFPPDLALLATSIRLEAGNVVNRETMLTGLIAAVDEFTEVLEQEGKQAILRLFTEASSYVSGRRVQVDAVNESLLGTTAGLDPSGFLILRKDDGTDTLVLAGGVRPA